MLGTETNLPWASWVTVLHGALGIWDVLVYKRVCNLGTLPKSTRRLSKVMAALSGKVFIRV